MLSTTVIQLSKSALASNLDLLRKHLKPGVRISSVVKGNAYGHQIETFVPLAEECGIDHFSVFNAYEAFRAFNSSTRNSTIMIMGMIDNDELEWAISNSIEFYIFEFDRLEHTLRAAEQVGMKARVHIEFETGLNRTGFSSGEYPELMRILKLNKHLLHLAGYCTHYAGAESIANHHRIKNQIRRFTTYCQRFREAGLVPGSIHSACSAAAFTYPSTQMDMVRIGIMQYGFWPSKETLIGFLSHQKSKYDPLKRVLRWSSTIMSTKNVKRGEFIGYGTSYLAQLNMRIATVPVGYSHGYSRSLSFTGRVLTNGVQADVVGIVNMNLLIIDITNIKSAKKGDEVVLIGKQGEAEITVASFSEFSNQLNYELLTRLPQSIPRVIEI